MTVCTLAQLNIGRSCRGPSIVIKSSGVRESLIIIPLLVVQGIQIPL